MDEGRKSGSRERRGWEENWPSGVRPPDHRARGGANPRYIPRGRVFASVRRRPWVEIHPSQHPRHHALPILTHGGETGRRGGSIVDAIYGTDDRRGGKGGAIREGGQSGHYSQDELDEEPHEPHDDEPEAGAQRHLAELLAVGFGALVEQPNGILGEVPDGLDGDVGNLHVTLLSQLCVRLWSRRVRVRRPTMSLAEVCESPLRWVIIRPSTLGKSGLQSSPRPFARAKRPLG